MEQKDIDLEEKIHGNAVYPWHTLTEPNAFFTWPDQDKRNSISASLRNYNKRNKTSMKVRTKLLKNGFIVTRIKDADPIKKKK